MDCVGDVCKMKPRCCSALPTAFDSIAEDAKNLLTTGFCTIYLYNNGLCLLIFLVSYYELNFLKTMLLKIILDILL